MRVIYTINEMIETARGWLAAGAVGFVPTTGNLHAGHLALVKAAQEECAISIVSIFVNPLQFSSEEELVQFPRLLARDLQLLRSAHVDVVFVPRAEDMYPPTFSTYITPTIARMERFNPANNQSNTFTYIYGLATVITKLFQIVRPDVAYFRQEATPEVAIVQKLVQDLNIDVALRILPENIVS
ncbi:MAG: hypothetical protein NVS4B1_12980 [Ktedonobacteraceae bacterium]